jgi:hypothetical protein
MLRKKQSCATLLTGLLLGYDPSLSSILRFRNAGCKRSTFSHGGLTRRVLTSGHSEFHPIPSGASSEFHWFYFVD